MVKWHAAGLLSSSVSTARPAHGSASSDPHLLRHFVVYTRRMASKSRSRPGRRRPQQARRRRGYLAGMRPTWHKVVGWTLIVIVNYLDYADLKLLPGGHNEGYFFLGGLIAVAGSWWTGLFDRVP